MALMCGIPHRIWVSILLQCVLWAGGWPFSTLGLSIFFHRCSSRCSSRSHSQTIVEILKIIPGLKCWIETHWKNVFFSIQEKIQAHVQILKEKKEKLQGLKEAEEGKSLEFLVSAALRLPFSHPFISHPAGQRSAAFWVQRSQPWEMPRLEIAKRKSVTHRSAMEFMAALHTKPSR